MCDRCADTGSNEGAGDERTGLSVPVSESISVTDKNASRFVVGSARDERSSACPCRVGRRAGHGSLRIAVSVPGGAGAESGRFDG